MVGYSINFTNNTIMLLPYIIQYAKLICRDFKWNNSPMVHETAENRTCILVPDDIICLSHIFTWLFVWLVSVTLLIPAGWSCNYTIWQEKASISSDSHSNKNILQAIQNANISLFFAAINMIGEDWEIPQKTGNSPKNGEDFFFISRP